VDKNAEGGGGVCRLGLGCEFCWCGSSRRSAEQTAHSLVTGQSVVSGQWSRVFIFGFVSLKLSIYLVTRLLSAIPLPSSSRRQSTPHSGSPLGRVHSDPIVAQGDGPISSDTRCQAGFQAIERLAQQAVSPRVVNRIPARSRAKR
jgi:hypothetical protein